MFQSTTKGVLHFEDLAPDMFERMYRYILDSSDQYEKIRSYGIEGSDEGVDILCVEKKSQLRYFIQCKRYQKLPESELRKIVNRIIEGNNDYKGQVLVVVTSCDVTKKAYENFEAYAKEKGFLEVNIIGKTSLDSLLHHEKYQLIKERCFGSEFDKEERARKRMRDFKVGMKLVEKKLLYENKQVSLKTCMDFLKHPEWKFKENEVIIRSIYDESYPDSNETGEYSTWFKSSLHDVYSNGIQIYVAPWIYETIIINSNGQWLLKSEFEKIQYEGEILELKVNIIGRIPFYNILDIEDGDNIFSCPHLFCRFNGNKGPFSEICYEYVDFNTYERILFEKGELARISEFEFQKLKESVYTNE